MKPRKLYLPNSNTETNKNINKKQIRIKYKYKYKKLIQKKYKKQIGI